MINQHVFKLKLIKSMFTKREILVLYISLSVINNPQNILKTDQKEVEIVASTGIEPASKV